MELPDFDWAPAVRLIESLRCLQRSLWKDEKGLAFLCANRITGETESRRPMPEGPEIQLAADKISRILVGQTLQRVQAPWPLLKEYETLWTGLTITAIQARGKALLTSFDNGDILYSHNQLYGRWVTSKSHTEPSSNRTLRVAFFTEKGSAYLYSSTDIEVLRSETLYEQPFLAKLGPDILDPDLTTRILVERLKSQRFRNRQLAALYLDQGFLAGPGNYLRSEILFCAGVHPRSKPSLLSDAQIEKLATTTLEISRQAYRHQGITTELALAHRLKAEGQTKQQYRHYVFRREGQQCRVCGNDTVVKTTISSRSVFYCPTCQG